MTFTADPADLSTALAQVRGTIGDMDDTRPLLTDEHITWRLGLYDDHVLSASIDCVGDILGELSRDIDRSNIGMSASRSQQINNFKLLLDVLRAKNSALAECFVGGLSNDAEAAINSDSDYRQIGLTLGWGKNTGT